MTSDSIYTIGGTVQAGSGLYVERAADAELLQMCREGAFAYVLTARQMGKSSLMTETARRLNDESIRTVIIDLNGIGTDLSAEQWYLGLATEVADQLDLATDALAWWNERPHMGPAQRLTAFLRAVVLHEVAAPIVIFIDEIDTTLSLAFTDDFYAAIRALYNARAQQPALERLSFVLIGVAIPGDLIKDPQRTPFNIGRQIELSDFRADEALLFAAGLNLPAEQGRRALARILDWTNGHPYLTQRLCAAVAAQPSAERTPECVDVLVNDLFLGEQSRQDNNVQFVRDMLTRRAPDPIRVLTTYRDVLRGLVVLDDERALPKAHLKLAGVVRRDGRALETRNRIYATVFDAHWVNAALPPDYLPRRLQRMGLIAIGMLVGLSLLLGVFLIGSRSREAELQAQKDAAVAAQQTSQTNEQSAKTAVANAQQAQATAVSAVKNAQEANRATLRQLMVSDAQAVLAEGNLDQARTLSIAALRSNPNLVQAQSVLTAAALVPSTRLRLTGHMDAIKTVAYSPDGKTIISGSWDATLRVWDVASGQSLRILQGHTGPVLAVAFSPDGKTVVSGSLDTTLRVWDVESGESLRTLQGHNDEVKAVAFSPDGTKVVSGSNDKMLIIWDVASGQTLHTLQGHGDAVWGVSWSPDGQQIVSSSADSTLIVWDVVSGQNVRTLSGHTAGINAVAYSPDSKNVVSASNDLTLRVWDVESGQALHIMKGLKAGINAVAYSPDGKTVVSGGYDDILRLWDVESEENILTLTGHTGTIWDLAYSPDGNSIVSGSYDHTLRLWDLRDGQEVQTLKDHTDVVLAVAYTPDSKMVVSGSSDHTLRVWDVVNGRTLRILEGHTDAVNAVAISPDGKMVVSGSSDHTLRVWDVVNGRTLRILEGHTDAVNAVVYSPDGKTVVSGAKDGTLRVWDVTTGHSMHKLDSHSSTVRAVAYNPNGKTVVSTSNDLKLLVWDVEREQIIHTISVSSLVLGLAFSPDGQTIASGSVDGTVQVWDTTIWQPVRVMMSHTDFVTAVAFSPDGQYIVSSSYDHTLRVWDVASGQSLRTLVGHSNLVWTAAFSPDGKSVVSGGWDKTLRLWPIYSIGQVIDWTYANRYVPELTAEQRARYGAALVGMDATPAASPAATAAP